VSAHASDEIDDRLLAEERYGDLVARHYEAMVDRARMHARSGADAAELANIAAVRLFGELRRGRRYRVPFRVVAHQVLTWTIKEWHAGRAAEPGPLPPDWDVPVEERGFAEMEGRDVLERAFAPLPPRDREVMRLRWIEGEEIAGIADRLRMSRNAVDQALHRGRRAVKEGWPDG
jgi:RNA polymerase sigma factor (sigma-70 family)